MIKVFQDEFVITDGQGKLIKDGNSLCACLACFFGVPLQIIPRLQDLPKDTNWLLILGQTLNQFGYNLSGISYDDPPKNYSIAIGLNKDHIEHACIYFNGKLFHDPIPDGNGLIQVVQFLILKKINEEKNILMENRNEN